MKKMQACTSVIILTIAFSSAMLPQEPVTTSAVPFLLINPSSAANGQGNSGVSRITDDPFAIVLNPAQLGLSESQLAATFTFYPKKTPWLPAFQIDDLTYDSKVLSGSMGLEKFTKLPLQIGFAYSRVDLNLGTFNITGPTGPQPIGTFHAEEHADAYSIGLGVDLAVRIAFGTTFRRIVSNLVPFGAGDEARPVSAKAWSHDFGFLVQAPIWKLAKKNADIIPGLLPVFDISLGTALTNVGGKLTYLDAAQADPLPRAISLGTTLSFGIVSSKIGLKIFTFSWSRQSDNLLISRDSIRSAYRGGFGDIDFVQNIILGKRTRMIDLSQGWELGVIEIAYVRGGSYDGTGSRAFSTTGFGLRTTGLFRVLKEKIQKNTPLWFIVSHFDIRYDRSLLETSELDHPLSRTKFSSIAIKVSF